MTNLRHHYALLLQLRIANCSVNATRGGKCNRFNKTGNMLTADKRNLHEYTNVDYHTLTYSRPRRYIWLLVFDLPRMVSEISFKVPQKRIKYSTSTVFHSQRRIFLYLRTVCSTPIQTVQVAIFSLFPANHLRFAYVITIAASSNRKFGVSSFGSNSLPLTPVIG